MLRAIRMWMRPAAGAVLLVMSASLAQAQNFVLWDRGANNNALSNATNWVGDVLPSTTDVAEFKDISVPTTQNGFNLNSDSLSFGAVKVNVNQTAFWQIGTTAPLGEAAGNLTLSGVDFAGFTNAAIVNESGQGGGVRGNLILDGGGNFVFSHNAGSGLEFDGDITESNGAASATFDGANGTNEARFSLRGNNTADPVYQLSGTITLQNKANLRILDSFDISDTGGGIVIDSTSRWNLESTATYTVASLTVDGTVFEAGTYDILDFGALRSRFEGADTAPGQIIVIGGGGGGGETTGDYNGDGLVDAADYTVWRDTYGDAVTAGSGADGDESGFVDDADYAFWSERFGNEVPLGSLSGAASAVPEPTALLLATLALLCVRRGK